MKGHIGSCFFPHTGIKGRGARNTSTVALQLFGPVYYTECNCASLYYLPFNGMSHGQIFGEHDGNCSEPLPRHR